MFVRFKLNYNYEIYSLRKFQMVYVCLKVMNEIFVNGCRPFIRINDCHLKSSYRGVLLSVVGLDDNNEQFSLVYVVVEYESNNT